MLRCSSARYGFGELTQSIATWLQTTQLEKILASPYIGISCDESTDRCRGKLLILFVTFIRDHRLVTEFMALLMVEKADAASLLQLLLSHVQACGVDLRRIVGISTDGASVMMGSRSGLVARLRLRIPHLISCHCIAHREALAAKDAADSMPVFGMIDSTIRAIAEHLGRSGPWHQRFMDLQEVFSQTFLELQGIHNVRWLSRGDAIARFVAVLHAVITMLKEWNEELYAVPSTFTFILHEDKLPDYPGPGHHDACLDICTEFAELIVANLEDRLGDLDKLSGVKLFTPDSWPLGWHERQAKCQEYLELLITLFRTEECEEIVSGVDKKRAFKEVRLLIPVLARAPKTEHGFHTGLTAMLKTKDWQEHYPNLVRLWVAVSVLPLSTVECERGFSRQNVIKSWQRGSFKDAWLSDLMCMSLLRYKPNWDEIVEIWRNNKKRKPFNTSNIARQEADRRRRGKEEEEADEDEANPVDLDVEAEGDDGDYDEDEMRCAALHAQIWHTTGHLEVRYVDCGDEFGAGLSPRLSPWLEKHGPEGTREVIIEGVDSDGQPSTFTFILHEDKLPDYPGPGHHDACLDICTEFAELFVANLEDRLGDLDKLSGVKLFTPDSWPLGKHERQAKCQEYLELLITLFRAEECEEIVPGVDKKRAFKEVRLLIPVLARAPKTERGFHTGLTAMLKTKDWQEHYPNLVRLWVAVSVLPLSTVECERRFSQQNVIKSWQQGSLKDARLSNLMCMSLLRYKPNWDEIVEIWHNYKKRKPFNTSNIARQEADRRRRGKEEEETDGDEANPVDLDVEAEGDGGDYDEDEMRCGVVW
ncbi:unnamed protein product [Closterium sp. NIES-53]